MMLCLLMYLYLEAARWVRCRKRGVRFVRATLPAGEDLRDYTGF